jgi:putative toxin-antitoxin system antitoxin component (TIGR02293 family)
METTKRSEFPIKELSTSPVLSLIGLPETDEAKLWLLVENGLHANVVANFSKELNWSVAKVLVFFGFSRSTYQRRKKKGYLNPKESQQVMRILLVIDTSTSLMGGNRSEAIKWLQEPSKALKWKTPAELITSETGALTVLNFIHKLMHGIYI